MKRARAKLRCSALCIILIICFSACSQMSSGSATLFLEISKDSRQEVISLPVKEVEQVGINERYGKIRIEITLPQDYHMTLESVTREMVGGDMVIKFQTETLFTGTLYEALSLGRCSFDVASEKEAFAILERMGIKLSYHLRLTAEEIETLRKDAEIASNPMIKKALEAVLMRNDLETGIQFVKRAVELEPSEPAYREVLSSFYYQQGNKVMALQELLTAERLSSKEELKRSPGILLSIADLYVTFDDYDKAKEYINRVLLGDPNNLLAHLDLAQVYERTGEVDLAMKHYSLISKAPDEGFQARGKEGLKRLQERQEEHDIR